MSGQRARRVGDEIKRVLSGAIQMGMKDPRIPAFTSVTAVEMSRDLSHATCYISVFGEEKAQLECIRALEGAAGFLRAEIAKKIRLRLTPELHFRLDRTVEQGMYMDALIDRAMGRSGGDLDDENE